jgi:hypothetical protein
METDSDDRIQERNAKISRNYGTMLVRDLRERYGENFAAGHADTATLREVINRLDAASLNQLHGDLEKVQLDEAFRPGPSGGLIDTLQHPPTG